MFSRENTTKRCKALRFFSSFLNEDELKHNLFQTLDCALLLGRAYLKTWEPRRGDDWGGYLITSIVNAHNLKGKYDSSKAGLLDKCI